MADVTVTPNPVAVNVDIGGPMELVLAPIKFLFEHFVGILFLVFIGVALVGILYIIWSREEEKKEQEDMLYKEYKDTIRSCKINQDPKMYTKYYSKLNWLFFLGLPIMKYQQGRKIYNKRQQLIGYYDGIFTDQIGNINILMWKNKSFIFLKELFVLRLPTNALTLEYIEETNKKTGKKEQQQKIEKIKLPEGLVELDNMDKTIFVSMVNHQKSSYYYYPVYQDFNNNILNLSETINTLDQINHGNMLVHQVIKEGGKNVINMSKQNTSLQYEIRSPEKVKEVEREE